MCEDKIQGLGVKYLAHNGWGDFLPDVLHIINRCLKNRSRVILSSLYIRQQSTQLLTAILDSFSEQRIVVNKEKLVSFSTLYIRTNKPCSWVCLQRNCLPPHLVSVSQKGRVPIRQQPQQPLEPQLPGVSAHTAAKYSACADGGPSSLAPGLLHSVG